MIPTTDNARRCINYFINDTFVLCSTVRFNVLIKYWLNFIDIRRISISEIASVTFKIFVIETA